MPPKEWLSPEEQKRREIANREHLSKTRLCNFHIRIQGQHGCTRGDSCQYAHSLKDLRPPLEKRNEPWTKVYADGNVDIQVWPDQYFSQESKRRFLLQRRRERQRLDPNELRWWAWYRALQEDACKEDEIPEDLRGGDFGLQANEYRVRVGRVSALGTHGSVQDLKAEAAARGAPEGPPNKTKKGANKIPRWAPKVGQPAEEPAEPNVEPVLGGAMQEPNVEPAKPTEEPAEPNAARSRGLPLQVLGAATQEPNVEPEEFAEEPAEPNAARRRGLPLFVLGAATQEPNVEPAEPTEEPSRFLHFEKAGRLIPREPPACRWWGDGEGEEASSSTSEHLMIARRT